MIKNMGSTDRILRLLAVVAIGLAVLLGAVSGTSATILAVVAGVLLVTSLVGTCPAYLPFGLSTRRGR
jgi:hypothetical protein